jgi:hypothetical protein
MAARTGKTSVQGGIVPLPISMRKTVVERQTATRASRMLRLRACCPVYLGFIEDRL